jgi:transcriptional regulator with XRE-family HTH domain
MADMEFHQKLRKARERKGLLQQYVADTLGVSRTALSYWESGSHVPAANQVANIAKLYGISLDCLFDNDRLTLEPTWQERLVEIAELLGEDEAMRRIRTVPQRPKSE